MQGGTKKVRVMVYREPKAFDAPYITTTGRDENGTPFIRYQFLPANICGHRVNVVYADVRVQPTLTIKIPSSHFHCIRCKIMGTIETMRQYNCT